MKISEYSAQTDLAASDVFLVNGGNGTKKITANDAIWGMLESTGSPDIHRCVYRGKSLGSSLTSAQRTNIQNGTFKGIWLGDYWDINGVSWIVADFNYWMNTGSNIYCKVPHLVMVPSKALCTFHMNSTNTTSTGYINSAARSLMNTGGEVKAIVDAAFGSAVLAKNDHFSSSNPNDEDVTYEWVISKYDLMSEFMVYGHSEWGFTPSENVRIKRGPFGIDSNQLALFRARPEFINRFIGDFWLRDIVNENNFAHHSSSGYNGPKPASTQSGIWPVFAIY